ncbi:hypothetical protein N657DRAFT_689223 [Parathielavia appendiculata]|uniref:Uncharacterized protein n=1 Tax=Parathielavia appendiculata TaxID=2587402 RepID=A0AAN6U490_9PEZI|nr:hypothetical protein N657DRAFT_689223 [Parathielavia appendiculata]
MDEEFIKNLCQFVAVEAVQASTEGGSIGSTAEYSATTQQVQKLAAAPGSSVNVWYNSQPTLSEGDNFWARVGTKLSGRPAGTKAFGKSTKNGTMWPTLQENTTWVDQKHAAASTFAGPRALAPKARDGGAQATLAEGDDFWAAHVDQQHSSATPAAAIPAAVTPGAAGQGQNGGAKANLAECVDFWARAGSKWSTRGAGVQASRDTTEKNTEATVRENPTLGTQELAAASSPTSANAQGVTQSTLVQPFADLWPREAIKCLGRPGGIEASDSTEEGEVKETV